MSKTKVTLNVPHKFLEAANYMGEQFGVKENRNYTVEDMLLHAINIGLKTLQDAEFFQGMKTLNLN